MNYRNYVCALMLVFAINSTIAQKNDTVAISASNINMAALKPGTQRWLTLIYSEKQPQKKFFWMLKRVIEPTTFGDKPALKISQVWEDKDSISHSGYTICDKTSFATLYHEAWRRPPQLSTRLDFIKKEMYLNDVAVTDQDTAARKKAQRAYYDGSFEKYHLNFQLDLEIFSILPYKLNRVFAIPYFDADFTQRFPTPVYFAVVGEENINSYEGKAVACWKIESETKTGKEVYWVSKKDRRVLREKSLMFGLNREKYWLDNK